MIPYVIVYRLLTKSDKQATQKRLELSTSAVTGRRSNQLSHWAILQFSEGYVPSKLHTAKTNIIIQTYHCFGYALDLLVTVSSMCYHTSTSALSTSSSSRGFTSLRMGYLILRGASRLDAFSVYPFPAWLLCYAFGKTTDTPAASPSRSSRTKDSSSQISYAHAG